MRSDFGGLTPIALACLVLGCDATEPAISPDTVLDSTAVADDASSVPGEIDAEPIARSPDVAEDAIATPVRWRSSLTSVVRRLSVVGDGLGAQLEYLLASQGLDLAADIQSAIDRGRALSGYVVADEWVSELELRDGTASTADNFTGEGAFVVDPGAWELGEPLPRYRLAVIARDGEQIEAAGAIPLRLPFGTADVVLRVTDARLQGTLDSSGRLLRATMDGLVHGPDLAAAVSAVASRCSCLGVPGDGAVWMDHTLVCAPELASGGCSAADPAYCVELLTSCAVAAELFVVGPEDTLPVSLELDLVPAVFPLEVGAR